MSTQLKNGIISTYSKIFSHLLDVDAAIHETAALYEITERQVESIVI
jgi:hypothetical protein